MSNYIFNRRTERRGRTRRETERRETKTYRGVVTDGDERRAAERNRSKKTRQKWLITKKATSLQISDVDPRLKNDTTATTSPRVVIRTTRLAVHPWSDGPGVGHGWSSGLLFLEREKSDPQFQRDPEGRNGTDLIIFPDFANEITESLVHVDTLLGRRLDKSAPQVFGEVATLCYRNGQ